MNKYKTLGNKKTILFPVKLSILILELILSQFELFVKMVHVNYDDDQT